MKNTKTNLIMGGIVALMPLISLNANANVRNNDIENLQKEINILKQRINNISSQDTSNDFMNSIFSGIEFHGQLQLEVLDSTNDGNTYGLFGGNIADKRYVNSQITALRFGAKKKLSEKSNFVFKAESTREYIRFTEVYLDYKILPKLTIDLGQMSIPLSLEDENDSTGNPFIDESRYYTVGSLFFTKGVGVKLKYNDTYGGITAGAYGNAYTDNISELNKFTFNARGYVNPYKDGNNVVHLGTSHIHSIVDDSHVPHKTPDRDLASFTTNQNLKYDLKQVESTAFEFATNYNWFNLQSEYVSGKITPASKLAQKDFIISNFYVKTSIVLTGETIEYKNGSFGNVKVSNPINEGGFGAFELAFKFAETDLNNTQSNILFDYGQYKESAVALNWMPMDFVRVSLQYSRVEEEFENPFAIVVNNNNKENKYNVFAIKGKIFF